MAAPLIALDVLAIQAEQIRRQIQSLQEHAKAHRLAGNLTEFDSAEQHCTSCDTLFGQVWAAFHNAHEAKRRVGQRTALPDVKFRRALEHEVAIVRLDDGTETAVDLRPNSLLQDLPMKEAP